jgi:riboflavin kinase/FMN adenylyltransferase
VVSFSSYSGEVVSSTVIRQHLAKGDIRNVSRMLGRTFSLHGPVTRGDGRGKALGFPTANIEVDSVQSLLPDGVYATRVYIDGEPRRSVTNIGRRPTFGANERNVEIHVMDYRGDLYGQELKLDIVDLLRGEKKFESVEDLKRQITEDIEKAKTVLDSV